MKIEKNKIVFAAVIVCVVLFIGAYSMLMLGEDSEPTLENTQIPVPKLQDEQQEYESKLEALDDLKDVRQTNAPSIYDERLLDSSGVYDPDLLNKKKMEIIDSIYSEGRINYTEQAYRNPDFKPIVNPEVVTNAIVPKGLEDVDLNKKHAAFFYRVPLDVVTTDKNTDPIIYAVVNRTQVVKKNFRLELRLTQPAVVSGRKLPKHTKVYGFVSFKPNRVMLHITNIEHQEVSLKAFDAQDGNEGIYIVHHFKGEASDAVVDDAIDQINIPSVPSTGVIKKVFQRSNRNIKITINDNYKLVLKSKL